jgi:hypothetical protein
VDCIGKDGKNAFDANIHENRHEIAARLEMLSSEILLVLAIGPSQMNRALPLMKPTTSDTAYLGSIESSQCRWSGIRWPSKTRLSFCSAKRRNTSANAAAALHTEHTACILG